MTTKTHDCPGCRCVNPTEAQTWAAATLIHTGNPRDQVSANEAFSSYLAWFRAQPDARSFYTQRMLTTLLKPDRRVELIGGRNVFVGYRLAS